MGLAEQLVTGFAQFAGLYTIEPQMMVTDENTNVSLGRGPSHQLNWVQLSF